MIDRDRRTVLAALSATWLAACGGGSGMAAIAASPREKSDGSLPKTLGDNTLASDPPLAFNPDVATTSIDATAGFSLPRVANAVTWTRYGVAPFPGSIMAAAPYGGTKHTRWARRTVDGCWYVLGGDYSQTGLNVSGSASNLMWRVTPGEPFPSWTQLNGYVPAPGHKIPAHVDEAPFIYDSKRDRFFLFPYARWANMGAESPDVIVGHAMYYYPATNTWEDLWTGTYIDDHSPRRLDPNGHEYPLSTAKWGFYDEATDKFYIPQGGSSLMVIDAGTLAMEWPIQSYGGSGSPYYPIYHAFFYTACLCVDRKRRRFVSLRGPYAYDNPADDPNSMKLWCLPLDPDPVSGLRVPYYLPQTNQAADPANRIDIDTECLVHDEISDIYILYGGGYQVNNVSNTTTATNAFRFIPAEGGTWKRGLPATTTEPPVRYTQTMWWEPKVGKFFMLGGIASDDTQACAPEVFYPVVNSQTIISRPAWRTAMTANTWAAVPTANTLLDVDPRLDPAVNPTYSTSGHPAPWLQFTFGSQAALIYAWNSAAYDDDTHTLFIGPAGGHGDYGGNERYRIKLDANAPAWECHWKPSGSIQHPATITNDSTGNDIVHSCYSDGEPRAPHNYNTMQYAPGYGVVMSCVPATSPIGNSVGLQAWKFDPVTGNKTLICDYYPIALNSGNGPACAYDPHRRCLWHVSTGSRRLWRINIQSGTFEFAGGEQLFTVGGAALFYMEEEDSLLLFSDAASNSTGFPSGFQRIPLSGPNKYIPTALNVTGSFASGFGGMPLAMCSASTNPGFSAPGIVWDKQRKRFVLWHQTTNTKQLSTLTPGANFSATWTMGALAVPGTGATPSSAGNNQGTLGRLAISHTYDGVFLLNSNTEKPFFYAFS